MELTVSYWLNRRPISPFKSSPIWDRYRDLGAIRAAAHKLYYLCGTL